MSEIIDHGFVFTFKVIGLMVDAVYCLTLLYVFCDCSRTATVHITKRVKNILMNVDLAEIDQSTRREVPPLFLHLVASFNAFFFSVPDRPVHRRHQAEPAGRLARGIRQRRQEFLHVGRYTQTVVKKSNVAQIFFFFQNLTTIAIYLIVLLQFKLSFQMLYN